MGNESKEKSKTDLILEKLEQGIKDLFESENYAKYLKAMSRFHNYSFNNCLLIAMQMPEATLVAGYSDWQKKHKRFVKKGEKGISILAPAPYKKEIEREVVDPISQKKEIQIEEVVVPAFRVVTVFDVSQTDGEAIPSLGIDELEGEVEGYSAMRKALEDVSPVPVTYEQINGSGKGFFSPVEQRIAIQEGMSEVQSVKTLIHETAHAKLHNLDALKMTPEQEQLVKKLDETIDTNMGAIPLIDYLTIRAAEAGYKSYEEMRADGVCIGEYEDITPEIFELHDKLLTAEANRRTKEVQAESVAYAVSQHFGIDTSEYSFGYIAGWSSDKDVKELRESMKVIRSAVNEMISSIEQNLRLTKKEEFGMQKAEESMQIEKQSEQISESRIRRKVKAM